ncbi:sensor histidine kinase [Paenibacillus massiliensis]|uniref:sensor histidine kinase n=1 Tax=Paenibacillus massiliensis TaxID=225917 RepID=UPI000412C7C5|nr:sensor histidine kinase [Paenibacillus massiliensis]
MNYSKKIMLIESDKLTPSRIPVILLVALVYAHVMISQYMAEPLLLRSMLFSCLMGLHVACYWYSHQMVSYKPWLYFALQGVIIVASALVLPHGFYGILIGLIPVLIGQSVGVYYHPLKVSVLFLVLYSLFGVLIVWLKDAEGVGFLFPFLINIVVVVVAYASFFFKQVHARVQAQTFLRELEMAHKKVEELTLANERQRMARDLHDTLAQGLAGIIMQLEAIDAHLTKGGTKRAHEIVQQSMSQARRALAEARQAIDDLRSQPAVEIDFSESVREEIERFTLATGIPVQLELDLKSTLPILVLEHGQHIIRECLTNVAKHAHARHLFIRIVQYEQQLLTVIRDDGKGFNTRMIGKRVGHYGLIGIKERVRLLGGTIEIESTTQKGTTIEIEVPIAKEA